MKKSELEDRIKVLESQLTKRVEMLEAIIKGINTRFIVEDKNKCIALPLTDAEERAVKETLDDKVSELWSEGTMLSGDWNNLDGPSEWEQAFLNDHFWRSGKPLPQWDGYYVAYSYSGNDGAYVNRIWGLKIVG